MSYRDIVGDWLENDEKRVPHAYQDSEGYWTIGVGRLIDKRKGGRLRDDEIDLMKRNDIAEADQAARSLFANFDDLSDNRKAVLLSMAFNLGRKGLAAFRRLRAAVEAEEWDAAGAEMLNSKWATQVKSRAHRLVKLMRDG